jgi:hypothetical protein
MAQTQRSDALHRTKGLQPASCPGQTVNSCSIQSITWVQVQSSVITVRWRGNRKQHSRAQQPCLPAAHSAIYRAPHGKGQMTTQTSLLRSAGEGEVAVGPVQVCTGGRDGCHTIYSDSNVPATGQALREERTSRTLTSGPQHSPGTGHSQGPCPTSVEDKTSATWDCTMSSTGTLTGQQAPSGN